jgi:hypothetical protein
MNALLGEIRHNPLLWLLAFVPVLLGAAHGEAGEAPWPIGLALGTLAGVTVLVGLGGG